MKNLVPRAVCAALLAVGLAGGPVGAQSHIGSHTPVPRTITIQSFTFTVPKSVAAGAQVKVLNLDGIYTHTVTSLDENCAARGEARHRLCFHVAVPARSIGYFTAPSPPGSYEFKCRHHRSMRGVLVVK